MAKKIKATGNDPVRIKGNGLSFLMSGDLQAGAQITSRSCVLCGPGKDCDCASVEFGSDEYFARIDRAHGRAR
jgi:hypothetical protein